MGRALERLKNVFFAPVCVIGSLFLLLVLALMDLNWKRGLKEVGIAALGIFALLLFVIIGTFLSLIFDPRLEW
jgi:uncharacterized membrane protein